MNENLFDVFINLLVMIGLGLIVLIPMYLKYRRGVRFRVTFQSVLIAILASLFTTISRIFKRGSSEYFSVLLPVIIASALITVLSMRYLMRSILNPLKTAASYTNAISAGNFSQTLPKYEVNDEIGYLYHEFEKMAESLKLILSENKFRAEKIFENASNLASTSEELASSSENIASTQEQISRGAQSQVQGISQAQRQFELLSSNISEIRENIGGIMQISADLTSIAEQTNILALNAAIEASRAGDAGKGFSVVAEQVRKLAEKSKTSVVHTTQFLSFITQLTEKQEEETTSMLSIIDKIASVSEETSVNTEESASVAEEQAASMENISTAIQALLKIADEMQKNYAQINF